MVPRSRPTETTNHPNIEQRCLRSRKSNTRSTPNTTLHLSAPPPPPRKQTVRRNALHIDKTDQLKTPKQVVDFEKFLESERPKPTFGHLPLELTPSPCGPSQAFITPPVGVALMEKSPVIVNDAVGQRRTRKKVTCLCFLDF